MSHNDSNLNAIKKEVQNSLRNYNKIIPDINLTLDELMRKAEDVNSKLTTTNNIRTTSVNDMQQDNYKAFEKQQTIYEQANIPKDNCENNIKLEFDSFRKKNTLVPKVNISIDLAKAKKNDKSQVLNNDYVNNCILGDKERINAENINESIYYANRDIPINPKELITQTEEDFIVNANINNANQNNEENEDNLPDNLNQNKNNIQTLTSNFKIDPFFFTNRYLEYFYEDKGDKLYDESDIIRNIFEKNSKKKGDDKYLANTNSLCFETYKRLLDLEKMQLEESKNLPKKENANNDMLQFNDDRKKKLKDIVNNYSQIQRESNYQENLINWNKEALIERKLKIKEYLKSEEAKKKNRKNNQNDEILNYKKKDPADISFKIKVQGEIIKKIRGSSKNEQHLRGILVNGPIAKWYRINSENDFDKEKGSFDIREIEDTPKDNNNIDKKEDANSDEEFTVKNTVEKGKKMEKPCTFLSKKILEFKGKSFKYFFMQLKQYFTEFYRCIEGGTQYNVLNYLSNNKCTSLEIQQTKSNNTTDKETPFLIKSIYWHPNLISLSIHASMIGYIDEAIKNENWECRLQSLTIIKGETANFKESFVSFFSNPKTNSIQNIHFIDMDISDGIEEGLKAHIRTFYREDLNEEEEEEEEDKDSNANGDLSDDASEEDSKNEMTTFDNYYQQAKFSEFKDFTIPILNLSFKRNIGSKERNENMNLKVDMEKVYNILMKMRKNALQFNKGTIPQVFNCLDLSESTIDKDKVKYLTKIVTKFKIIKELNLSNTKITESDQLVIESESFLPEIKLTKDFDSVVINNSEDIKTKKKKDGSNDQSENDLNYNLTLGIYPILEKIYLYNSDIKPDNIYSNYLYQLFGRLKFFQGYFFSTPTNQTTQENQVNIKTIENVVGLIHANKKKYCENIFLLTNDDNSNNSNNNEQNNNYYN